MIRQRRVALQVVCTLIGRHEGYLAVPLVHAAHSTHAAAHVAAAVRRGRTGLGYGAAGVCRETGIDFFDRAAAAVAVLGLGGGTHDKRLELGVAIAAVILEDRHGSILARTSRHVAGESGRAAPAASS